MIDGVRAAINLFLSVMVELFVFLCVWWWSKLTWFFGCGPIIASLRFSVSIEIGLVFAWVVDIDFNSVCGIELDLIQCRDRN